jgi:hypothetical protein
MAGSKPAALPLGYTPAVNHFTGSATAPPGGDPRQQRALGQPAGHEPRPAAGSPPAPRRAPLRPEGREDAATGARQQPAAGRSAPPASPGRPRRPGIAASDHGLAVVAPPGRKKAVNCRFRVYRVSIRGRQISAVDTAQSGQTTRYQAGGRSTGREALADALRPGAAAVHEHRHVGAQPQPSSASRSAASPGPTAGSATSTVAASELPPPRPPPAGMRLRTRISALSRSRTPPAAAARPAPRGPAPARRRPALGPADHAVAVGSRGSRRSGRAAGTRSARCGSRPVACR